MSTCKIPAEHPLLLTAIIDRLRGNSPRESVQISCESYKDESNFDLYLTREDGSTWQAVCDGRTCDVEEQVYHASSGCGCGESSIVPRDFKINRFSVIPDPVDMGAGGSSGSGGTGGEAGAGGASGEEGTGGASGTSGSGGELVADTGTGGIPPDARVDAAAIPADAVVSADLASVPVDAALASDAAPDVRAADAVVPADAARVADLAPPPADVAVPADIAALPADVAPLPADAAALPDSAVVVAEDAAPPPADAAPVEQDSGFQPPPIDLEQLVFAHNPLRDQCSERDVANTSLCLRVSSAVQLSGDLLFNGGAPVEVVFELDGGRTIPEELNPAENIRTYIEYNNTAGDTAMWSIVKYLDNNGQLIRLQQIGSLMDTVDNVFDENGQHQAHTIFIEIDSHVNRAAATCAWAYPALEGSLCQEGR